MKNKGNKAIIIAVCICSALLAVFITVFAFLDCWIGYAKLSEIRKGIAECEEIVITSPLYHDAYSSGAEAVVYGEEARELVSDLLAVSDKKSYDGTLNSDVGFWDTRMMFQAGEESCTLYVCEDSFYVAGKSGYRFVPDNAEAYGQFYADVCALLDGAKDN